MEVSSHALALRASTAIHFAVAAFTNLTQDHLDFHADMEDYFAAKRRLFAGARCAGARSSTSTIPTAPARRRVDRASDVSAAGATRPTCARASSPSTRPARSSAASSPDGAIAVRAAAPGRFNVENALARRLRRARSGSSSPTPRPRCRRADRVPGRFEPVDEGQPFAVLVDYAHTPDALETCSRRPRG